MSKAPLQGDFHISATAQAHDPGRPRNRKEPKMSARARVLTVALLAVVVAVSSALAGADAKRFTVASSLDGKRVLPLRIHWIAHPHNIPGQVAEIDYFIDGKKAWDEHQPPYYYGGYGGQLPGGAPWRGGNWLVTSFLKPGLHTFTVRALTLAGRRATDTVKARVIAAPPPPASFAGTWTRIVTPDDLKKGPPGPPAGPWTLHITSVGWGGDGSPSTSAPDATGWAGSDRWDVRYLPNGNLVMGPEIVTPKQQSGGFCGVDPPHTWTVGLSADDQSMRLDPLGTDACGVRVPLLQGTWTRVQ
jgi:hypothetical protein